MLKEEWGLKDNVVSKIKTRGLDTFMKGWDYMA